MDYKFPGPPGAGTITTTEGAPSTGSGNTMTVGTEGAVTDQYCLKMVVGAPTASPPVAPTAVSSIDYWSDTASTTSTGIVRFGPPSAQVSGFTCFTVPVGGYQSTGTSTTLRQWYDQGTSGTTGGGVRLRLQVMNKVNGLAVVKLVEGATSKEIIVLGDLTPYEGTAVMIRHQIRTGFTDAGARVWTRFYSSPFAAVGAFVAGTDVSSPAITGTGAAETGGWNLGSSAGAAMRIGRYRIGYNSVQAVASVTYWHRHNETSDTLSWVAGPTASAAVAAVAIAAGSTAYPEAGQAVTVTVAGSSGTTTLAIAAPPVGHAFAGELAYPEGTTPPTITNPATTGTTTITGLQPGQTWVRCRVPGATDTFLGIFTHAANNATVGVQSTLLVGWTVEGTSASGALVLNDELDSTLLRGPETPTAAEYMLIRQKPYGAGEIQATFRLRQRNTSPGDTSSASWTIQLVQENGTVLDTMTVTTTAAESGVFKDVTYVADADAMSALGSALANRRALRFKVWGVVA